MHWLLLTVLAVISRASYSLATKVVTNRLHVSASTQNFLLTGCAMILGLLLSPLLGGISFVGIGDYWPAAVIMILCTAFGGVVFFMGQKHLDASTTQIAFSSILLWGVLLSIGFLGSRFTGVQAIGIALLFAAIVLTQYRKGKRKLDAGVLWIIASAALFAGFQVASADLAKQISGGTYLLLSYGGPTVVVGLVFARTIWRELPVLAKRLAHSAQTVLFAAGTSLGYYVFSYFAYRQAPDPGLVVILLTSQVVITVLLGILFMRERENVPRKLAAGSLAFLAAILIKG